MPSLPDGTPFISLLHHERRILRRAGVSYLEWRAMTRWQRREILDAYLEEAKMLGALAKKGLGGMVTALVRKILGF